METWAFFKKEKKGERYPLKGLYKTEEKAKRRLIYEDGIVAKIIKFPKGFEKYIVK